MQLIVLFGENSGGEGRKEVKGNEERINEDSYLLLSGI